VLLVPDRIARHAGAIVAIAAEPDDPSIEAAKAIAVAAKEDLIVIETFRTTDREHSSATYPTTEGWGSRISVADGGRAHLSRVWSALHHLQERLVVVTRSDDYSPSSITSMRHVPILIVEPRNDGIRNGS
jgi:hypothetical protein